MIAFLKGSIKYKGPNYIILLTGGVGYKVFVPQDVLGKAEMGKDFEIFTFTNVRDDAIELFGFELTDDLALFELFLTVPGVGPKTALNIFSNSKVSKIKEAIIKGDVDFFSTIPRLGRKNAQKIIIELRSKLGSMGDLDLKSESPEVKEIIDALRTFGFSTMEAKEAIKAVKDLEGDTSFKIKQALKYLGKK